jgi:hypothetical protein
MENVRRRRWASWLHGYGRFGKCEIEKSANPTLGERRGFDRAAAVHGEGRILRAKTCAVKVICTFHNSGVRLEFRSPVGVPMATNGMISMGRAAAQEQAIVDQLLHTRVIAVVCSWRGMSPNRLARTIRHCPIQLVGPPA